MAKLLNNKF